MECVLTVHSLSRLTEHVRIRKVGLVLRAFRFEGVQSELSRISILGKVTTGMGITRVGFCITTKES